ncbi:MAG: ABC transporter ATP-binding protein [Oscillospiraceae bacterium]|nr:ABC transporter ATP-binding protein [Oscillospiraceae bacterium]
MYAIETQGLTKDYGRGKGIFDVTLQVPQGEAFGFLGPNGAGKTTTIRHLLGFIRPQKGRCGILGKNCFDEAAEIQRHLGYLPGELAFLDGMTGKALLDFLAQMKNLKDKRHMTELIDRFELDPSGPIKKMSKGMKQKLGLVAALMARPSVLILDEPTSGFDPLMQNRFVELILEEKERGTTVFMSSHMFEEVARTCDRTAILRDGKIAAIEDMASLKNKRSRHYVVTLDTPQRAAALRLENFEITSREGARVVIPVQNDVQNLLRQLSALPVQDLDIRTPTLEEIFLCYYGGDRT